jgi:hypothetical protein
VSFQVLSRRLAHLEAATEDRARAEVEALPPAERWTRVLEILVRVAARKWPDRTDHPFRRRLAEVVGALREALAAGRVGPHTHEFCGRCLGDIDLEARRFPFLRPEYDGELEAALEWDRQRAAPAVARDCAAQTRTC